MPPPIINLGVIVRTCGRSPFFLRRALNSIIAQTVLPALIVVVDDSADGAKTEVELAKIDFRGIGLKFLPRDVRTQPRSNRSAALNRGIASVETRWVTFLDDDDTWTPRFLEQVADVLATNENRTDFGGVVTQTSVVFEQESSGAFVEKKRKPYNPDLKVVDLAALAVANRFTINAMVVHRELFAVVGPYREDLPVLEDWEFNVRAAAKFHFAVIPECLACYHLRPEGDSAANSHLEEHHRTAARIRNEWLRADLAAGRMGLGQLALAGEIRGLGALLEKMRNWRKRIFGSGRSSAR